MTSSLSTKVAFCLRVAIRLVLSRCSTCEIIQDVGALQRRCCWTRRTGAGQWAGVGACGPGMVSESHADVLAALRLRELHPWSAPSHDYTEQDFYPFSTGKASTHYTQGLDVEGHKMGLSFGW